MSKITDALTLANSVHSGQVDNAGDPYMKHILRVWEKCRRAGGSEDEQVVAILHDTIEDDTTTAITPYLIATLFNWDVAHAVNDLTRNKGEEYLLTYIPRVRSNPIAKTVKFHDLYDHLNRLSGDESGTISPQTRAKMRDRYTKAITILSEAVE